MAYLDRMIDAETIGIAFDTETTGLAPAEGRIVEIAALKFDLAGNTLGRFVEMVNPLRPIPAGAMAVHHITDDMVADKPPMTDVLPRFLEFIAGDNVVLIAQNAVFDIGFVNHEAIRCEMPLPPVTIFDQIELTRRVFPGLATYSLEPTCRRFGLVDTQEHRAMGDAVLVMKLFFHCLARLGDWTQRLEVLNGLFRYSFGGPMQAAADTATVEMIVGALEAGRMLEIVYAGGSMRGKPRRIVPTSMFNRDGIDYIVANCILSNTSKQFRLDRVLACRVVEAK
ncbi:MAG: WYL domain-containing protein [candidate division Zixibacteria bacterium]|nr:WYL domain-containing protein [candidate division Zixibacteria bacterium]